MLIQGYFVSETSCRALEISNVGVKLKTIILSNNKLLKIIVK